MMKIDQQRFKQSIKKASLSLWGIFPIILGVVLLVSLANVVIPKSFYFVLFSKVPLLDSLIGSMLGSVFAGSPITSYLLGGELLNQGISLIAVTAFIVAWVTVGIIQLPAESLILGKKFAIVRNFTAFIFAIFVAIITVGIINLI